ncbi:hypothetical protein T492DRAFT_836202 [Pavlovales sp. CCMP2436]|nr:hypothetical protein T492DRAFT_836202 [Pavlovales sp. CCMP2436]
MQEATAEPWLAGSTFPIGLLFMAVEPPLTTFVGAGRAAGWTWLLALSPLLSLGSTEIAVAGAFKRALAGADFIVAPARGAMEFAMLVYSVTAFASTEGTSLKQHAVVEMIGKVHVAVHSNQKGTPAYFAWTSTSCLDLSEQIRPYMQVGGGNSSHLSVIEAITGVNAASRKTDDSEVAAALMQSQTWGMLSAKVGAAAAHSLLEGADEHNHVLEAALASKLTVLRRLLATPSQRVPNNAVFRAVAKVRPSLGPYIVKLMPKQIGELWTLVLPFNPHLAALNISNNDLDLVSSNTFPTFLLHTAPLVDAIMVSLDFSGLANFFAQMMDLHTQVLSQFPAAAMQVVTVIKLALADAAADAKSAMLDREPCAKVEVKMARDSGRTSAALDGIRHAVNQKRNALLLGGLPAVFAQPQMQPQRRQQQQQQWGAQPPQQQLWEAPSATPGAKRKRNGACRGCSRRATRGHANGYHRIANQIYKTADIEQIFNCPIADICPVALCFPSQCALARNSFDTLRMQRCAAAGSDGHTDGSTGAHATLHAGSALMAKRISSAAAQAPAARTTARRAREERAHQTTEAQSRREAGAGCLARALAGAGCGATRAAGKGFAARSPVSSGVGVVGEGNAVHPPDGREAGAGLATLVPDMARAAGAGYAAVRKADEGYATPPPGDRTRSAAHKSHAASQPQTRVRATLRQTLLRPTLGPNSSDFKRAQACRRGASGSHCVAADGVPLHVVAFVVAREEAYLDQGAWHPWFDFHLGHRSLAALVGVHIQAHRSMPVDASGDTPPTPGVQAGHDGRRTRWAAQQVEFGQNAASLQAHLLAHADPRVRDCAAAIHVQRSAELVPSGVRGVSQSRPQHLRKRLFNATHPRYDEPTTTMPVFPLAQPPGPVVAGLHEVLRPSRLERARLWAHAEVASQDRVAGGGARSNSIATFTEQDHFPGTFGRVYNLRGAGPYAPMRWGAVHATLDADAMRADMGGGRHRDQQLLAYIKHGVLLDADVGFASCLVPALLSLGENLHAAVRDAEKLFDKGRLSRNEPFAFWPTRVNPLGLVFKCGSDDCGERLNPREIKPFVHEVAEDAATIMCGAQLLGLRLYGLVDDFKSCFYQFAMHPSEYWGLNFDLAGPDGAPLVYTDLRLSNAVMHHVPTLFDAEEAPIFDAIERDPGTPAEYQTWAVEHRRLAAYFGVPCLRLHSGFAFTDDNILLAAALRLPANMMYAMHSTHGEHTRKPGAHITRTLAMMHAAKRWIGFLERTAAATWSEATPLRISVSELHVYSNAAQEADWAGLSGFIAGFWWHASLYGVRRRMNSVFEYIRGAWAHSRRMHAVYEWIIACVGVDVRRIIVLWLPSSANPMGDAASRARGDIIRAFCRPMRISARRLPDLAAAALVRWLEEQVAPAGVASTRTPALDPWGGWRATHFRAATAGGAPNRRARRYLKPGWQDGTEHHGNFAEGAGLCIAPGPRSGSSQRRAWSHEAVAELGWDSRSARAAALASDAPGTTKPSGAPLRELGRNSHPARTAAPASDAPGVARRLDAAPAPPRELGGASRPARAAAAGVGAAREAVACFYAARGRRVRKSGAGYAARPPGSGAGASAARKPGADYVAHTPGGSGVLDASPPSVGAARAAGAGSAVRLPDGKGCDTGDAAGTRRCHPSRSSRAARLVSCSREDTQLSATGEAGTARQARKEGYGAAGAGAPPPLEPQFPWVQRQPAGMLRANRLRHAATIVPAGGSHFARALLTSARAPIASPELQAPRADPTTNALGLFAPRVAASPGFELGLSAPRGAASLMFIQQARPGFEPLFAPRAAASPGFELGLSAPRGAASLMFIQQARPGSEPLFAPRTATSPGFELGLSAPRGAASLLFIQQARPAPEPLAYPVLAPRMPGGVYRAFLQTQLAQVQYTVVAAVPMRTLTVKRGAWHEWETFCTAAGVEPVRTMGEAHAAMRPADAATERDLQLAFLVWALGRVKPRSNDDEEGKPASAFAKILAVRRVHTRAGMAMVPCKALAFTVKSLERSYIERHGTQSLHPARKLPLIPAHLRAIFAAAVGKVCITGMPPVDWGTPFWAIFKAAVLTIFYQGFRGDDVLVSAARPFTGASLARAGLEWWPPSLDRHAARPAHAPFVGSVAAIATPATKADQTGAHLARTWGACLASPEVAKRNSKHSLRIGAATSLLADWQSGGEATPRYSRTAASTWQTAVHSFASCNAVGAMAPRSRGGSSERASALPALDIALSLEEIDPDADLYYEGTTGSRGGSPRGTRPEPCRQSGVKAVTK